MELVKTDPLSAVSNTVAALEKKVASTRMGDALVGLMRNLPEGTDYEELERSLPPDDSDDLSGNPIRSGRDDLLRTWARADPAGAADYVISNPDRIDPKGVATIAEQVVKVDRAVAVDWVQDFPEGPYFDQALYGVFWHIVDGYPQEATELAMMIGDPDLREEVLTVIRGRQARREGTIPFKD